jgi:murein DD-endopeptidase MepM/ murein hydrolase activator NlpD
MINAYSILVLRGTQMRRFVVSPQELRQLLLLGATLFCFGWVYFSEQFALQKKKVEEVVAEAQTQKDKLSALRDRTKEVQEALARWKGLREKIQASLPRRDKASGAGRLEGEELQQILGSLQSELKRMIASLPTDWPVEGRVVSGLGMRPSPWTGQLEFHAGLDIPKPIGTPVRAAGDAVVSSIDGKRGTIVLDHGQDIKTQYAHLSKIFVNEGEQVHKGQAIAQVGNTGKSTGPHLHYEVRVDGVAVDPRRSLLSATPLE